MSTVDVPGVGAVDKRVLYGVGAGTACLIGYIYWRRGQASADPGVEAFDESSLVDTGEYGGGKAWSFAPSPTGDIGVDSDTSPRTNAEWGQRAQEALQGAGYDVTAASAAIGAYIGHQRMTAAQAVMIRAAIGLIGSPPSGTFAITTLPTTTATPTPTPAGSKPAEPRGVHVTSSSRASLTLAWQPVVRARSYRIYGPGSRTTNTTSTTRTLGGLKPGTNYTVSIVAINPQGESPRATVTGRTEAVPAKRR